MRPIFSLRSADVPILNALGLSADPHQDIVGGRHGIAADGLGERVKA